MTKSEIISTLYRYEGQSPRIDLIVRDLRNEDERAIEFVEYLESQGFKNEMDLLREVAF